MSSSTTLTLDTTRATGALARPRTFWQRLVHRPLAAACAVYLVVVVGIAILAPIMLPSVVHEGAGDLLHVHALPSRSHVLGTDTLGRDVLNRLLVGTRVEMLGVAEALVFAIGIGVPIGVAAGYLRGRFDRCVSWAIDLVLSLPGLIIVLVVVAVFARSLLAAMVTIGLLSVPWIARVVRGATLPVREELYIAAAKVSGLSRPYVITRHVLPRIAGLVIVQTFLFAAGTVGVTAGLGYLGVLDNSVPTWGGMVQDGIYALHIDPWLIWPPGIAIGLTVLAFTLLGDAVRDATTEAWSAPPSFGRTYRRASRETTVARGNRNTLLSIEHLGIAFPARQRDLQVVSDVSFDICEREIVGLVGESGCGKTITAMAILGLLPGGAQITSGSILYGDRDLRTLSEREYGRMRGSEIALISQEPTVSLTPTFRVGWQIAQLVRRHQGVSRRAARAKTIELLRQVQLPDAEFIARRYVHELSGGMAQRVAIARALAGDPRLLIADEPTTALDVTVQAEILQLLKELQQRRNMAVLLITHDWGVVADLCDRAVVMYAGEVIERAAIGPIFQQPLHPYTEALFAADPHNQGKTGELPTIPGAVPRPGDWPTGCHFHPRCRYATSLCREALVPLQHPLPGRETRCIHFERLRSSQNRNGTRAATAIPTSGASAAPYES